MCREKAEDLRSTRQTTLNPLRERTACVLDEILNPPLCLKPAAKVELFGKYEGRMSSFNKGMSWLSVQFLRFTICSLLSHPDVEL